MSESTAVSRVEPSAAPYALRSPVAQLLSSDQARAAIEPLVPAGVSYQRVILEVYQATVRNPDIKQCTPTSIIMAVGKAVATGLVIGDTVHLVPFNKKQKDGKYVKELEAIRDYRGDIQLVVSSGAARSIIAKCVYENEPYEYREGTTTEIVHRPIMDPKTRGKMIGAYAVARLARGDVSAVQMSVEEIDAIRKQYSKQWKDGTLPDWYARKTVVKQVAKMLPKNPQLAAVLAKFERESDGEEIVAAPESLSAAVDSLGLPRALPAVDPEDPYATVPSATTEEPSQGDEEPGHGLDF